MRVPLEDFTPYDQSVRWKLHDAYFASRGVGAWTEGEVPWLATNNLAVVRPQARILCRLVDELERAGALGPADPVVVMEVGGGLGRFAAALVRALRGDCGARGRDVAGRLCFVFTDYSDVSLRQALRTSALLPLVDTGRVVGALLDLLRPEEIVPLDGAVIPAPPIAVFASYVACVLPPKILRRHGDAWEQQFVRASAELPDAEAAAVDAAGALDRLLADPTAADRMRTLEVESEFRPCDLDALFPHPLHAAALRRLTDGMEAATVMWPQHFVEFLRRVAPRLAPSAMVIVNDYGTPDRRDLAGTYVRTPQHYGNALSHQVNFALFDAVSDEAGWRCARTTNPFRSVHAAAIRLAGDAPASFLRAFRRHLDEREDGEDFIDFSAAGRAATERGEHQQALRFLRRAEKLDPGDAGVVYRLGEACVEGGYYSRALEYLERARLLDDAREHDVDFQIGRANYNLGDYDAAIAAYERSLQVQPHHVTWANLAVIRQELGQRAAALACAEAALRLAPQFERAQKLVEELRAGG